MNYTEARLLLSYDYLFAGTQVTLAYIYCNFNYSSNFTDLFFIPSSQCTQLLDYIRFVTYEVAFGGPTITKPVHELLFGFVDPFIESVKYMSPQLGGDPSLNPVIALNDLNFTYE